MKKLDVIAIESFPMNTLQKLPKDMIKKLYQFLSQSYHIADQKEFQFLIIQPEEVGELTVFHGINDEIAGFSRTWRQSMAIGKKQVTTYIAYIYLNPAYRVSPTVANTGLTQAIQYKLNNPHEELIYVAFANNPPTYEFISQLCDTIYPKPSQKIPEQILTVINALKNQNGWISTHSNPMVVSSPLVPLRSYTPDFHDQLNESNEFYIETNPDYMQGNSLLIYIPLHLANINYGLNYSDSTTSYTPKSPHHPDPQPEPSYQ